MLTRIRPLSHRYQVATETGCPSGRTVAIVDWFGLARSLLISSGTGGFGTDAPSRDRVVCGRPAPSQQRPPPATRRSPGDRAPVTADPPRGREPAAGTG